MNDRKKIKVGVFVTCLVDSMRPSVGFATVKLLEDAGCDIYVPAAQTCCGQPAYNSGDIEGTIKIIRPLLTMFDECDYVVCPSGSCAGMLKKHLKKIFADSDDAEKANILSNKIYEIVSFLYDILKITAVKGPHIAEKTSITYHDSCSGLRELGIKDAPRNLLKSIKNIDIKEMDEAETCCGFGGMFCMKYPDISNKMVAEKIKNIKAAGADMLAAGDLGCLMNMAGKLSYDGVNVKAYHIAEILSGHAFTTPSIIERAGNEKGDEGGA